MPTPSAPQPGIRGRADICPGALRLHPVEDGWLARVRVPGGQLTVAQARMIGLAAVELGDGNLGLTSRGNVQLRGLAVDAATELRARLRAVGLLPSLAHDRARNIVASPLSGLDGCGHLDVSPWVQVVDTILCSRDDLTQLGGRFLIGMDDGRGDVASLHLDVTVIGTPDGMARLRLADVTTSVIVAAADAARLAVDAAAAFLTVRADLGSDGWRAAELSEATRLITRQLGEASYVTDTPRDAIPAAPVSPRLGVVHGPDTSVSLSVLSRLGQVSAEQWHAVTELATAGAAGSLRITPWRGIIIPHVRTDHVADMLSTLDSVGFLSAAGSPWSGTTACTGRPGCGRSLSDVRSDATAVLSASTPGLVGLPVHWSGCARRCGHPSTRHVGVVASETGYHVGVVGEASTPVPLSHLADAVQSARRNA